MSNEKFGIDTSLWQGNFDFKKAKDSSGVEFAILKIGGGDCGLYKDSQFENSYNKCVACGLDKGAYFFGKALTMADAKKEAEYFIALLKGYKFEYPVFYDVEADMLKVGKSLLTKIIKYVCNAVEKAGYWVGIYGSVDNLQYYADDTQLKIYSHWGASWQATKPTFKSGSELQMWQFGGSKNAIRSTKINGQTVDQSYCYKDYPALIKKNGLNGYSKVNTDVSTGTFVVTKDCYTLYSIGKKYGTTVAKLKTLNPTVDANNICIGDKIIVPIK